MFLWINAYPTQDFVRRVSRMW